MSVSLIPHKVTPFSILEGKEVPVCLFICVDSPWICVEYVVHFMHFM